MSRRHFTKLSLTGAAAFVSFRQIGKSLPSENNTHCVHLGCPVFGDFKDPKEWIHAVKAKGYSAAYCPVPTETDEVTVKAFEKTARDANIVIPIRV